MAPRFGGGGFRRLLERGAFFPDCRHLAASFSASAIATLATGAWPAQHGIVADTWYDRTSRRAVPASGDALAATTLAAQVASEPRSRVFVVAFNQEHAALCAGTRRAQLFWMDARGQFAATGEWPDWLAEYNRLNPVENLHDAPWRALGAKPGAPALRTLKFDPAHPEEFLALYKASPLGQETQFAFLAELVARERLGQGEGLDLVCLVAGSGALLGYETGGRSPLMDQLVLRLDQHLEYLLNALDKTPGEAGYSVVVAGAHGAPPAAEGELRSALAVSGEALAQLVDRALTADANGRVEKYIYPYLYLDSSAFRDPEPVRLAAARAAMQHPAVSGYYTAGGASSTGNGWERRFRNSFHPKRSGDVMLSYLPEYVEDSESGRGISYGSLYNYDVRVPLVFYGPQFRAGVFGSPVESIDLAPTLARALGVAAPSSSTGRALMEAFGRGEA